jgi:hypothetical protein
MTVSAIAESDTRKPIAVVAATHSGALAIDKDSLGGNPFATALIKVLARESKNIDGLMRFLTNITKMQSHGKQVPELLLCKNKPIVPFASDYKTASKLAMIMVYSDYSVLQPIPGAEFDLNRLKKAFKENGFECWTLHDPSASQVKSKLKAFKNQSTKHDFAVLYVTGHGAEIDGKTYLLPADFRIKDGKKSLKNKAFDISDFQTYLKAKQGNFLFFGGCRNNPF